jgi:hypothetical protein
VKESLLSILNVLAARHCHGSPLFKISNGERMESAKKKCENYGCPGISSGISGISIGISALLLQLIGKIVNQ